MSSILHWRTTCTVVAVGIGTTGTLGIGITGDLVTVNADNLPCSTMMKIVKVLKGIAPVQ